MFGPAAHSQNRKSLCITAFVTIICRLGCLHAGWKVTGSSGIFNSPQRQTLLLFITVMARRNEASAHIPGQCKLPRPGCKFRSPFCFISVCFKHTFAGFHCLQQQSGDMLLYGGGCFHAGAEICSTTFMAPSRERGCAETLHLSALLHINISLFWICFLIMAEISDCLSRRSSARHFT